SWRHFSAFHTEIDDFGRLPLTGVPPRGTIGSVLTFTFSPARPPARRPGTPPMPQLWNRSDTVADVVCLLQVLHTINGRVEQLGDALTKADPAARPPSTLVTLSQLGAIVHRSKRTMQRYRCALPPPRILGRPGRPHRWAWADVRPWLQIRFGI